MNLLEQLLITHIIADWFLQNKFLALAKVNNWKIRTIHCLIVSACFFWLPWPWLLWTFATHWAIDTYRPLFWIRKLQGHYKTLDEFKESFNTPAGFMINVTMDQMLHILCFIPMVLWWK